MTTGISAVWNCEMNTTGWETCSPPDVKWATVPRSLQLYCQRLKKEKMLAIVAQQHLQDQKVLLSLLYIYSAYKYCNWSEQGELLLFGHFQVCESMILGGLSVGPSCKTVFSSYHFVSCWPLFWLPLIFSGIRIFSSDLCLCITCPKYLSFSFVISVVGRLARVWLWCAKF